MKTKLIAALLIAILASSASTAFASGYGPAPAYRPAVGSPASQRGQSEQTLAAERADVTDVQAAYGGVVAGSFAAGRPAAPTPGHDVFAHH